jgi:ABC-type multidrug transport system ATPase subunit
MTIEVQSLGHSFNRNKLFHNLTFTIPSKSSCAIVGANGSGKSTIMQILAGRITPQQGTVTFKNTNNQIISTEEMYAHIAWTAPMIELYSVLTVREAINLHARFKPLFLPVNEILDLIHLTSHRHKPLKNLSSGMMQRLKVGLALFSKSSVLLLDEPTGFMDESNTELFLTLIHQYQNERTYILASNIAQEWQSLTQIIKLESLEETSFREI